MLALMSLLQYQIFSSSALKPEASAVDRSHSEACAADRKSATGMDNPEQLRSLDSPFQSNKNTWSLAGLTRFVVACSDTDQFGEGEG